MVTRDDISQEQDGTGSDGRFMAALYRSGDYPAALGRPQAALAREWGDFVERAGTGEK